MQLPDKFILKTKTIIVGKDLESIPIIIADTSSENSLLEMAKQAKVVLNCVGPVSNNRDGSCDCSKQMRIKSYL
jgi:hypothetical protein